jgi:hypothetical protein
LKSIIIIIIIIKSVFHASGSQSEECIADGSRDHRTPSIRTTIRSERWGTWDQENGSKQAGQKPVNQYEEERNYGGK